MKQFYLAEIVTKDKLIHQGIFFRPKKAGKRAMLWVHGLTSTFYNALDIHEAFADACEKEMWGYASFNNRGHDMIAGGRRFDTKDPKGYSHITIGSGNENFTECVYDISAAIDFLVKQGFNEIILIGQSTGANKVCYFGGTQSCIHIVGFILVSPICDRLIPNVDQTKVKRNIAHMKQLSREGKGDEFTFGYHYFPLTPKRYLSMYFPNSFEDTFAYGDAKPKITYFSHIQKPLLVVLGGVDESADRPVKEIKKVFDAFQHSKKYNSLIIPNALHSFNGKEEALVKAILQWIRML